jgi:hypothetical protein
MDYGETFDSLFRFGDGDPNFILGGAAVELPIMKSDNDTVIASVAGFDGCFPTGNPDGLYWYGSTDAGNTWFGYAFGYGSGANPEYGQIINGIMHHTFQILHKLIIMLVTMELHTL